MKNIINKLKIKFINWLFKDILEIDTKNHITSVTLYRDLYSYKEIEARSIMSLCPTVDIDEKENGLLTFGNGSIYYQRNK